MSTHTRSEQQHLTTVGQKITHFFCYHPSLLLSLLMLLALSAVPYEKPVYRQKDSPYRIEWKDNMKHHLLARFGEGDKSALLSSLLMGSHLPEHLKALFKKTGLLHVVAISGFHFSLLRGCLFFILGFFFRGKGKFVILLLFLAGYAFFLGPFPSVLRAFFSTLILLLGDLFNRRSKPLNTFGLSLVATLVFDWKLIYQLSFQLSFGITYAILTLYPFLLEKASFPTIDEVRQQSLGKQWFLVCRTVFEKSLLFSLAVYSIAIPMSLYAFGAFPLISLLINLLFTPLFSLLLGAFLLATLFPFLDPIVAIAADGILFGLNFFDLPLPQLKGQCPLVFIIGVLSLLTCLPIFCRRGENQHVGVNL